MSLLSRTTKRLAAGSSGGSSARHFAVEARPHPSSSSDVVSRAASLGAQASVAGVLAVSTTYLIQHPGSLDSTAPRSGMLHYDYSHPTATIRNSSDVEEVIKNSAAERVSRPSQGYRGLEANRELRMASELAKTIWN
ncbi:hypothetical protein P7C70_g6605, partial [Phenoliferia sp. Uapishka_3]